MSKQGPIYLYYLPGNTVGTPSYFTGSKAKTDPTMLEDNMFYTITVEDDLNRVYQEPPAPKIAFHGENVSITLNTVSSMAWDAMDGLTGKPLELGPTKQTETSVTYTIVEISQPVVFYPHTDTLVIKYEAEPDGWQHKIGQFEPSVQAPQQSAMVKGKKTLLVEPGDGDYTLLAPDVDRIAVTITGANNHTMFYSFAGWKVVSAAGSPVLPAGTVLTADDLNAYAGSDGVILLQAVWSGVDSHNRPNTVHFSCISMERSGARWMTVCNGRTKRTIRPPYIPPGCWGRTISRRSTPIKCGGCGKAAGSAGNQWRQCLRGG